MRNLVTIGACYLDTILTVDHYPGEDEKLRASRISRRRGGNTLNTLEVLQQLLECGSSKDTNTPNTASAAQILSDRQQQNTTSPLCAIAVLPARSSPATRELEASFGPGSRVDLQHCIYREQCSDAASSYIIKSASTGSRTIGRIPAVTRKCIQYLRQSFPGDKVSVEVEKPGREGLQDLAAVADVVFYSKSWAQANGYGSLEDFLRAQSPLTPRATIGAGDTFIAGMLHHFIRRPESDGDDDFSLLRAMDFANHLAGRKVVQEGFEGLGAAAICSETS
ncbi:kinase, pfkB family protein [Histoplasma capsulatum]|uniref:Kinase, pfkB family protein n=1 Tax=Ajellomyces capsulatus TaxID=5037 RepID=A0A8A1MI61_AJECA|nr:kinase, pfkB family protein [Histoplasma capsulatum]